jgi:glucokinase
VNVLAVDLGGTKTALALVDQDGRIARKEKLPAASSFEATLDQIETRLTDEIVSVGVTVPGIYDPQSGDAWAPNLWGRDFHPLRAALSRATRVPIAIGSDRTAAALAEHWLGAARGLDHVVFVAVGTGIGVGIVCGGRPIEGAHGTAGAAGWMVLGGPWKPQYAERGGWETEAAGPAVARRGGMESAEAVVSAARAGDTRALAVMDTTADYLALGVTALIAVLDPEIVVLGGGLMQASDLILNRIRANATAWTQPIAAARVRIEQTLLGEDAGLLGAARLAWLSTGSHSKE